MVKLIDSRQNKVEIVFKVCTIKGFANQDPVMAFRDTNNPLLALLKLQKSLNIDRITPKYGDALTSYEVDSARQSLEHVPGLFEGVDAEAKAHTYQAEGDHGKSHLRSSVVWNIKTKNT